MRAPISAWYVVLALSLGCSGSEGASTGKSRSVGGSDGGNDASEINTPDGTASGGRPGQVEAGPDGNDAGGGDRRDGSPGNRDARADAGTGGIIDWGCSDEPPPMPLPPLAVETVRAFADAFCARMALCDPGDFGSEELCRQFFLCGLGTRWSPGITAAMLEQCTQRLAAAVDCSVPTLPLACALAYTKRATEGERCNDVPCDDGLYCRPSTPEACPVCTRRKPLGEPCELNECDPGLYCDGTCKLLLGPGDACVSSTECTTQHCIAGTCRVTLALGESCTDSAECGRAPCIDGVCTLLAAWPGEPCDPLTPCVGGLCEEGTCTALCVDGVVEPNRCAGHWDCAPDELCDPATARCAPRAHEGEACDVFAGNCIPGQRCDVSRGCVPLLENGAPCSFGAECQSTFCLRGTCAPRCACEMP